MSNLAACLEALDALFIPYELVRHAPLDTMEKCREAERLLNVTVPRNIFLCTSNQKQLALLTLSADAPFRTAVISPQAGLSRLSFAPEGLIGPFLGCYAGAVSPLGLMYDREGRVRFLLDEALLQRKHLGFHPLDNTATVKIETEAFINVFLPSTGHAPRLVRTRVSQA